MEIEHTATTGSFDVAVAVEGLITLMVRPCEGMTMGFHKKYFDLYSQSSEEGNTVPKIELTTSSMTSSGRPVRIGSVMACCGQPGPMAVALCVPVYAGTATGRRNRRSPMLSEDFIRVYAREKARGLTGAGQMEYRGSFACSCPQCLRMSQHRE